MSPHALATKTGSFWHMIQVWCTTNQCENGKGGITLKGIPRVQHICHDHSYMRYSCLVHVLAWCLACLSRRRDSSGPLQNSQKLTEDHRL
eukprot:jgi/Botrbrau1/9577/Bobra.106_2s0003.1